MSEENYIDHHSISFYFIFVTFLYLKYLEFGGLALIPKIFSYLSRFLKNSFLLNRLWVDS